MLGAVMYKKRAGAGGRRKGADLRARHKTQTHRNGRDGNGREGKKGTYDDSIPNLETKALPVDPQIVQLCRITDEIETTFARQTHGGMDGGIMPPGASTLEHAGLLL